MIPVDFVVVVVVVVVFVGVVGTMNCFLACGVFGSIMAGLSFDFILNVVDFFDSTSNFLAKVLWVGLVNDEWEEVVVVVVVDGTDVDDNEYDDDFFVEEGVIGIGNDSFLGVINVVFEPIVSLVFVGVVIFNLFVVDDEDDLDVDGGVEIEVSDLEIVEGLATDGGFK